VTARIPNHNMAIRSPAACEHLRAGGRTSPPVTSGSVLSLGNLHAGLHATMMSSEAPPQTVENPRIWLRLARAVRNGMMSLESTRCGSASLSVAATLDDAWGRGRQERSQSGTTAILTQTLSVSRIIRRGGAP
jgi:hypothetical protein